MSNMIQECVICMEDIVSKDTNYVKTVCGHEFHTSCLMTNVAHNGSNCFHCPSCRTSMAPMFFLPNRVENQMEVDHDAQTVYDEDHVSYDPDDSFRGMRLLFSRVEEAEAEVEEDPPNSVADEDLDDIRERNFAIMQLTMAQQQMYLPPSNVLATFLQDRGITFEDLVKCLLYGDADYNYYDLQYGMTFGRVMGKIVAKKKQFRLQETLRQFSLLPDPVRNRTI